MGCWQLEVARMIAYIGFPVTLFHWFNQSENFTSYVQDINEKFNVKEPENARQLMNDFIAEFNKKSELDEINAMEEQFKSQSKNK